MYSLTLPLFMIISRTRMGIFMGEVTMGEIRQNKLTTELTGMSTVSFRYKDRRIKYEVYMSCISNGL